MYFQRETVMIYPSTGCCLFKNLGKLQLLLYFSKTDTSTALQCCQETPISHVENADVLCCCGHLGGRPRCITVHRRGVRIKLSTAKVRRSKKCSGIKGARITTSWDTPGYLPCECRASLDLGYRPPKTHLAIVSGEVRRSENSWRASTTPNSTVFSQIELMCVQRGTAQIP